MTQRILRIARKVYESSSQKVASCHMFLLLSSCTSYIDERKESDTLKLKVFTNACNNKSFTMELPKSSFLFLEVVYERMNIPSQTENHFVNNQPSSLLYFKRLLGTLIKGIYPPHGIKLELFNLAFS